MLRLWKDVTGPLKPLAPGNYQHFSAEFRDVCRPLGFAAVGLDHPYQLRHGGTSFDVASGFHDTTAVMKKGRWKSQNSMRRCERGGRLSEILNRLEPARIQAAVNARRDLFRTLAASFNGRISARSTG